MEDAGILMWLLGGPRSSSHVAIVISMAELIFEPPSVTL